MASRYKEPIPRVPIATTMTIPEVTNLREFAMANKVTVAEVIRKATAHYITERQKVA